MKLIQTFIAYNCFHKILFRQIRDLITEVKKYWSRLHLKIFLFLLHVILFRFYDINFLSRQNFATYLMSSFDKAELNLDLTF